MYTVLVSCYEFLSEFVPFIIVLFLLRRRNGKYASPPAKQQYMLPSVLAFYMMAVFHITGAGTLYDAFTAEFEEMKERVNLLPFSNQIDLKGYLLNIVLFIPLGFFASLIWKRFAKTAYIFLTGFGFSLLIEASQLLSYRGTDVDDLILNTLGAMAGFLLYKVWNKVTKSKYQLDDIDTVELPTYILTLYLGRFLLFNQVGLIELVYGI